MLLDKPLGRLISVPLDLDQYVRPEVCLPEGPAGGPCAEGIAEEAGVKPEDPKRAYSGPCRPERSFRRIDVRVRAATGWTYKGG